MPILQESQKEIFKFEQETPILFNINWRTRDDGCLNLACHCWPILGTFEDAWKGEKLNKEDKSCPLHLFEETCVEFILEDGVFDSKRKQL